MRRRRRGGGKAGKRRKTIKGTSMSRLPPLETGMHSTGTFGETVWRHLRIDPLGNERLGHGSADDHLPLVGNCPQVGDSLICLVAPICRAAQALCQRKPLDSGEKSPMWLRWYPLWRTRVGREEGGRHQEHLLPVCAGK